MKIISARVGFGANADAVPAEKQSSSGIESFWAFAKHRLARFKGLPRHTFYLHLKECEFCFNHRRDNLYLVILQLL